MDELHNIHFARHCQKWNRLTFSPEIVEANGALIVSYLGIVRTLVLRL